MQQKHQLIFPDQQCKSIIWCHQQVQKVGGALERTELCVCEGDLIETQI